MENITNLHTTHNANSANARNASPTLPLPINTKNINNNNVLNGRFSLSNESL